MGRPGIIDQGRRQALEIRHMFARVRRTFPDTPIEVKSGGFAAGREFSGYFLGIRQLGGIF